jgi:ABC-2 type transport system permease protein
MLKKAAKYSEYLRISFLTMLAYRARYFVGITTYLIYISVNYFIWKAIFENSPSIGSYTFSQMITYITIGWISRSFYYNRLESEIAQKVVKGDLALDLLKPVNFQWMQYARTLGEAIFRLFLFTLPTYIVALFFFPIPFPKHFLTLIYFMAATFNAFMLFTTINYLVGLFAIPLQNIEGLSYAKSNLMLFFSGLLIPFDFLPGIFKNLMMLLPFGGISYIPLQIYLEKFTTQQVFINLSTQLLWVIILHYLGQMAFRYFTRRLVIQGG